MSFTVSRFVLEKSLRWTTGVGAVCLVYLLSLCFTHAYMHTRVRTHTNVHDLSSCLCRGWGRRMDVSRQLHCRLCVNRLTVFVSPHCMLPWKLWLLSTSHCWGTIRTHAACRVACLITRRPSIMSLLVKLGFQTPVDMFSAVCSFIMFPINSYGNESNEKSHDAIVTDWKVIYVVKNSTSCFLLM